MPEHSEHTETYKVVVTNQYGEVLRITEVGLLAALGITRVESLRGNIVTISPAIDVMAYRTA